MKTINIFGYTWWVVTEYPDGSKILEREIQRTPQGDVIYQRRHLPQKVFQKKEVLEIKEKT